MRCPVIDFVEILLLERLGLAGNVVAITPDRQQAKAVAG